MRVSKILHDKAMEFVDEAKLAAMEGKHDAAQTFCNKAFALEKEAVENLPAEGLDAITPWLYRRSAAWLAFQTGNLKESKTLLENTLYGNPPDFIRQQLLELKTQLQ